jgi:ABC-type lipoprotein export system ATPase subunit
VAVVRALVMQPSLVLADEPTGSLDQANAAELFGLLLELHRERGTALLVVTHATGFVTEFDRRLGIDRGKLDDLDQDTPYRATPNDPASPNPPES